MSNIYQIKIGFRAHNSAIALNFTDLMKANVAWAKLNDSDLDIAEVVDDGGSKVMVSSLDVMFLIWTDLVADAKMSAALQLHQARMQARLQGQAAADPELRAAQTVNNLAGGGRLQA